MGPGAFAMKAFDHPTVRPFHAPCITAFEEEQAHDLIVRCFGMRAQHEPIDDFGNRAES